MIFKITWRPYPSDNKPARRFRLEAPGPVRALAKAKCHIAKTIKDDLFENGQFIIHHIKPGIRWTKRVAERFQGCAHEL